MANILLINGPNLNLLGTREPDVYGEMNLDTIEDNLMELAKQHTHSLDCFQSNAEHEIVNKIQTCQNPGIASQCHVQSQINKKLTLETVLQFDGPDHEDVVKMTPKLVPRGSQNPSKIN